jgi:hypothetical protein
MLNLKTTRRSLIALLSLAALAPSGAGATPYQIFRSSTGCSNNVLCELNVATVAVGKTLEVQSLSCEYQTGSQTAQALQASFDTRNSQNQYISHEYLVPTKMGSVGIGSFFAVNQPTTFFVFGGQKLVARFSTNNVITSILIQCKVTGNIT